MELDDALRLAAQHASSFVRRMGWKSHDELVQAARIRTWREYTKRGDIDERLLGRVATHAVIDEIRAIMRFWRPNWRGGGQTVLSTNDTEYFDALMGPDLSTDHKVKDFVAAIEQKLRPQERRVFVLVCKGVRAEDAGRMLGIAAATVWKHLRRSEIVARDLLGKNGHG